MSISIHKSIDKLTGSIYLVGLAIFSSTVSAADSLTIYERSNSLDSGVIDSFTSGGTQSNWTLDRWIDGSGALGNGQGLIGQTFTADEEVEMASVSLKVAAFSSLASGASNLQFNLSVYEFASVSDAAPTSPGSPLASFTGTMPEAFAVGNWMTFAFDETVSLGAGDTYGFTLEIIDREGEDLTRSIINYYGSSTGGYDGGRTTKRVWSDGGSTVSGWGGLNNSSGPDLYFSANTTIPEANSIALIFGCASFLAVVGLRRRNRE